MNRIPFLPSLKSTFRARGVAIAMSAVAALTCTASIAHAATFVYVSNEKSQNVSVFDLNDQSGQLSAVTSVPVGGNAMPMAVSPNQLRLYVGIRTEPYHVESFAIDPRNGHLTSLGKAPMSGSMAYLSTDSTGRYLFSASYGGHHFSVNAIAANGVAADPQQDVETGPQAHSIMSSPDNRFVFGAVLGSDKLMRFHFSADDGKLTDTDTALQTAEHTGPRFFRFSPDNRFVYLIDEEDGQLRVLSYGKDQGTVKEVQTISALPDHFGKQTPWTSDIHLTPDGRYLYVSERRSSTISGFRVNKANGRLSRIGSWPSEAQPRGFAIDPSGRYLIAAGEKSGHLQVYRLKNNGQLDSIGRYAAGDGPNWIEIVHFAGSVK